MAYQDPRGIRRTVKAVHPTPEGNYIRFVECDHTAVWNPIYDCSRTVGERHFCFECGQEAQKETRTQ